MSTPVYSPIPATVKTHLLKIGQFASKGDYLVELEPVEGVQELYIVTIRAPHSGRIMRCRDIGETVRAGERVAEIASVGSPTMEIFVAYRRSDSPGHAGRIGEGLIRHFGAGEVFKDVESLKPLQKFADVIRERLSTAFVMVVVIGPRWANDPRLHDSNDLHREEIRTALQRGIFIAPVVVAGAAIPRKEQLPNDIQGLLDWQVHEMSETRWSFDFGELARQLEGALSASPTRQRFLAQVPPYQSGPGWQYIESNPKADHGT